MTAQEALVEAVALLRAFAKVYDGDNQPPEEVARAKAFCDAIDPPPVNGVFPDRTVRGDPAKKYVRRFCGTCKHEITRNCWVLQVEGSDAELVAMPAACPHCGWLMAERGPAVPKVALPPGVLPMRRPVT